MKQLNFINKTNYATLIMLVLCFFGFYKVNSQTLACEGAAVISGSSAQNLSGACAASYTGSTAKYKAQSTYIPATNDPVITIKLVAHIAMPTIRNTNTWDNSNNPDHGLPGLNDLFNRIQDNQERYSLPRSANYNGTGISTNNIHDSRLRYEVVAIYFYSSDYLYYGYSATSYTNPVSIVNPELAMLNYINQNYPNRLGEGLPICILKVGQHQSVYTSNVAGRIPYVAIESISGETSLIGSLAYNNSVNESVLRHEIGHATGLLHNYYGGNGNSNYYGWSCISTTCNPLTGGLPAASPETNVNYYTGYYNSSLDCNNPDYLVDVFGTNNPACPAQCPPTNTTITPNPPVSNCGSCYERNESQLGSNNIMSANSVNQYNNLAYPYGWISPLQMGRRLRSMHLISSNTWYGLADWANLRYFAKDMISGHDNPWLITSNETWDFDIQMYKDIVVKTGNTLKITCKVAMATDGRIIVEPGAKLIIDGAGALVTGWCKKAPLGSTNAQSLWEGIEVQGNPNQNQLINNSTGLCANQGIVEIKNGATISGAFKAIKTSITNTVMVYANPTTTVQNLVFVNNTAGGIVIANGANFINNVYDIIFYKYQMGGVQSKVINCNFKTTGSIGLTSAGANVPPKEHIKLYQNWGLTIQGCNFEYSAGGLYGLSSRGIGLYTTDSHFTVDQYCTGNCSNPTRTTFKNLSAGAWLDNFNALYTGTVKNCDFIDNQKGMVSENSNYFLFTDNNVSQTGNFLYGMYLYKSKYYTVTNSNFNTNWHQSTGIVAFDSQDGLHQIYRNNISNYQTGIMAVDNNGGYNTNTPGLKMNCNVFNGGVNTNDYDIAATASLISNPVIMKDQSPINPQSASQLVRNLYGAPYFGPTVLNKFYKAGTQGINHASTPNGADNPNTPSMQASSIVQVISVPNSGFAYSVNCPALPASTGGTTNLPAQKLINLNNYIASLRGDEANNAEIQAAVSTKLRLFLSDSTVQNNDSVVAILQTNQGAMTDADIQLVLAHIRNGNYTGATTKANALAANRADWKGMLLKLIEIEQEPDGIYSLLRNTANVSFLQDYANTEGRDGQAMAQAMLRFVFETEHQYPVAYPPALPGDEKGRQSNTNQIIGFVVEPIDNPNIHVYPNPAQTGFTVFNSNTIDEPLKVEVKDLFGRLIYTNFIGKNEKLYVPLNDYTNGVYILTLNKSTKEIVYRNKLVKQD